jgi:hypothetical protein
MYFRYVLCNFPLNHGFGAHFYEADRSFPFFPGSWKPGFLLSHTLYASYTPSWRVAYATMPLCLDFYHIYLICATFSILFLSRALHQLRDSHRRPFDVTLTLELLQCVAVTKNPLCACYLSYYLVSWILMHNLNFSIYYSVLITVAGCTGSKDQAVTCCYFRQVVFQCECIPLF